MAEQRLQKILSQAGVASRRKAEELITEGRVTVNGEVVTELGSKANFEIDHVKVDGRLLHAPKRHTYLAMNKPKGCVTTVSDPEGRETVMHLLRGVKERVFPVGRLDYQSEGLLLFTNDGEFAHKLTSPATHVTKTYVVKVNGQMTEEQQRAFREGVSVHGRRTSPAEIRCVKQGENPWYEVKLTEGRQNQIRLMFSHFGKLVEKLRRVKIAFLELDVAPGRYRSLTGQEVEHFQRILSAKAAAPKAEATAGPASEAAVEQKPERAKFPPKPRKPAAKFPPRSSGKKFPPRKGSTKLAPRPTSGFSPRVPSDAPSKLPPRPAKFSSRAGAKFAPKPGSKFPSKAGSGSHFGPAGSSEAGAASKHPSRPSFDKPGLKFPPKPASKFSPRGSSEGGRASFNKPGNKPKFPPRSDSRGPGDAKSSSKFPPKRAAGFSQGRTDRQRNDGKRPNGKRDHGKHS